MTPVDPAYVQARTVLLDALEALVDHLDACILVGAQAVYEHTGDSDLAVVPTTTDADLALDPRSLAPEPLLADLLAAKGFAATGAVGGWQAPSGLFVDLMVPEVVGGAGRRGARLGPHGKQVARKSRGLDGVLLDRRPLTLQALGPDDPRRYTIQVAGPASLIIAKLHKLEDRQGTDRLQRKDALDIFRLLQAVPAQELAAPWTRLAADPLTTEAANHGRDLLAELFADGSALGPRWVGQALDPFEDPALAADACAALARALLGKLGTS